MMWPLLRMGPFIRDISVESDFFNGEHTLETTGYSGTVDRVHHHNKH